MFSADCIEFLRGTRGTEKIDENRKSVFDHEKDIILLRI
jgi:hypothetical protein